MITPGLEEFRLEGGSGSRPIWRDLMADIETPLSAYWKLAHDEEFSFLLESVTGGEQLARYSVIGVRPRKVVREKDGRTWVRVGSGSIESGTLAARQDPLDFLRSHMDLGEGTRIENMPKFYGGAVGMLGYDFVRHLEKLPIDTEDDLGMDDLAMMVGCSVVVFDHAKNLLRIIVEASTSEEGYATAVEEIERIAARLQEPLPALPEMPAVAGEVASNRTRDEFENSVRAAIDYIGAGDAIQVVLSQRFSVAVDAHPVSVYRSLRSLNPSPYMFLLRFGDFDIVGASPEILVSLTGREATVRPIAGTRPRGGSVSEDELLAAELLADEKELAEHVMLVDLGRNDLGRISEIGSVQVRQLMQIERYSHVMHIVSEVTGRLAEGKDAFDLVRATFPAGTVSGAPKVRAMQIIEELEPTRRGLYAGAVGYFANNLDLDLCIAIRTILMKDGRAYVQAGAGIVYDSNPISEFEETKNKARACLKALGA